VLDAHAGGVMLLWIILLLACIDAVLTLMLFIDNKCLIDRLDHLEVFLRHLDTVKRLMDRPDAPNPLQNPSRVIHDGGIARSRMN
jgi:hypothetical protein